MLKFSISTEKYFSKVNKSKWAKYFFIYRLDKIKNITDISVYDKAYSTIIIDNNTLKTTKSGRFSDINNEVNTLIKDGLKLHDVAVSSGITTLEWYKKIKEQNKNVKLFYSDKFSYCKCYKRIGITFITDYDEKLLHIYWLGVYADKKLSNKYFISKYLFYILKVFYNNKNLFENISLYKKELQQLTKNGETFEIVYDVIENKSSEKFDIMRVMNLLNLKYFSKEILYKGIANLYNSLNENGYLIIGRTDGVINNATIYKKERDSLTCFKNINKGSEVQYIVDNFNNRKLFN